MCSMNNVPRHWSKENRIICERIHLFVVLLLTCQKFVSKVFTINNNNNNKNNNNDNNSNDKKVEEIVLPRILQYSFLSIV